MPSLVTASWRGHKFSVRPTFWKRVDREPTTRRGQGLSQPSLRNLAVTRTHYIFRGDPHLQGQSWREPFDSCTSPHGLRPTLPPTTGATVSGRQGLLSKLPAVFAPCSSFHADDNVASHSHALARHRPFCSAPSGACLHTPGQTPSYHMHPAINGLYTRPVFQT